MVLVTSTNARDDGLRRISTITRWVAAVGVAGTALLAAVVYRATPGRATTTPPTSPAGTAATVPDPNAGVGANAGGTGNPGFQAPTAPVPAYQPPVVRSGGS
jgi:hypothetical protein